jgi:hypothetical protein
MRKSISQWRTKDKPVGLFSAKNGPQRSALSSATDLRRRGRAVSALRFKAFFEQQFNLLTQRPAFMLRDLGQSRLETYWHPHQQRDSRFRHGYQQK